MKLEQLVFPVVLDVNRTAKISQGETMQEPSSQNVTNITANFSYPNDSRLYFSWKYAKIIKMTKMMLTNAHE